MLTGIVNTTAGSGTIFSVGTMLFLDVPLDIANTTNRLGVLFQNLSGILAIRRHGGVSHAVPFIAFFSTFFGALLGAYFAVDVSEQSLNWIALVVILAMSIHIITALLKIEIFLLPKGLSNSVKPAIFFCIGCYGGFIQIGVGIVLLLGLKAMYGLDWIQANYFKLLIILAYTIPTLLFFGYSGMVLWVTGGALALGQIIGAYLAGWGISINEKIAQGLPYIILIMLLVTGVKLVFR